ncbi:MAG TPA: tRNA epoxyqueuosine(34) reductase QueG [Candidatus Binataceae bacterium]|nr:tRNA epoxyqueuosine(34) reductase QueG [Candidatus Binataceae bacterium]
MRSLEKSLADAAFALGFSLVGFAALRRLEERRKFFGQWIGEGRSADMEWLAREPERRFDPRVLDPRLRGMVSLAYPYAAPRPPEVDWRSELRGRVAAYALGPDYHDVVLEKARTVSNLLASLQPGAIARLYVDTGPVFEREWAAEARLGWFGRNTNLINRYQGSYFFLAEIFTDVEFDSPAEPYRDHCGTCRQCLDLCPTHALADGLLIEPRLCISYLTIEHRGAIPRELRPRLGNWIFGCDICQEVCPWNGDAAQASPVNDDLAPSLDGLMRLDHDGFSRRFRRSAIKRTKRRGLLRNAAVALGNSGNPAAVPILARALEDEPEALVRSHAAWALGQFDLPEARHALTTARVREPDLAVKDEIETALRDGLS